MTLPPFAYFGGKQRVADAIVALLPEHGHYVEHSPGAGGARTEVLWGNRPFAVDEALFADAEMAS